MKVNIVAIIFIFFFLFISSSATASTTNTSCADYINSLGIPENPKTVTEFQYLSIAIGEIKEVSPDCIPNTSEESYIKFEKLFSESVIDNFISTYASYQVVQMALADLKTTISGISSWYAMDKGKFALERARLYLLQFYVMLKSLEIYDQNTAGENRDGEQLTAIKAFVFNDIEIVEAYIKYNTFFGELNESQHHSVGSKMKSYINRLKSISMLKNDKEYQERLDSVFEQLNTGS